MYLPSDIRMDAFMSNFIAVLFINISPAKNYFSNFSRRRPKAALSISIWSSSPTIEFADRGKTHQLHLLLYRQAFHPSPFHVCGRDIETIYPFSHVSKFLFSECSKSALLFFAPTLVCLHHDMDLILSRSLPVQIFWPDPLFFLVELFSDFPESELLWIESYSTIDFRKNN